MNKSTIATIVLTAGGLVGLAPSIAIGETQSGLNIADNDSVYIDGNSFQIIPGKAKGEAAVQIKNLPVRDLGPAAIVIRSGGKLYIADAQSEMAGVQAQASIPGRNAAYDPQAYNPRVLGGGSLGYNHNIATDYAYDPRAYNPTLQGGGSVGYNRNIATDYVYDQHRTEPSLVYNPAVIGGASTGYNQRMATDYAYDPRSINPALQGGGSVGYNRNIATDYAYDPRRGYDPRQGYPIRNPNPWANDYAYDPSRVAAGEPSVIYDPNYVEYRLKKAFEDNWTPGGMPSSQHPAGR